MANQQNAFPTNWKCSCGFDNRPINLICGGSNPNLGCSNPKPGHQIPQSLLEAQAITKQLQDYLQKELVSNVSALSGESLNSVFSGLLAIITKIIESRGGNVAGQELSQIFKVMIEAKLFSKNQGQYIENHIIAAQNAIKENPNLELTLEQKGAILKTICSLVRNISQGIIPWVANGCNGKAPGEGGNRHGKGGRGRRRGRGGRRRGRRPPNPAKWVDWTCPKCNTHNDKMNTNCSNCGHKFSIKTGCLPPKGAGMNNFMGAKNTGLNLNQNNQNNGMMNLGGNNQAQAAPALNFGNAL